MTSLRSDQESPSSGTEEDVVSPGQEGGEIVLGEEAQIDGSQLLDGEAELLTGVESETESAEATSEETPELNFDPVEMLVGGSVLALLGAALLPLADAVLARAAGAGARIPGAVFFARWGFGHVATAAAVWLVLSFVVALLFSVLEPCFLGMLLASQGLMASVALVAFFQVRRMHPEGIAALGLRWEGTTRAVGGALLVYVLALPTLFGVARLWPGLAQLFGKTIELQDVAQGIFDLSGASLWTAIFVAAVVAPFFEEIVFRGYLQPLLVQNLHAPAGILVTSVIFASMHGDAFLPVLALSMVLGWIHWRTHRTLACVAVHMLHNGSNIVLLLLSSGATP